MRATMAQHNGSPNFSHPLYAHLACEVLPIQGIDVSAPAFVTTRLSNRYEAYLDTLKREFSNLSTVCKKVLYDYHHRVVRPLSMNEQIACLLVEDFARGHDLDYYISKAAYGGRHDRLFRKLTKPALFLAAQPDLTDGITQVCFEKYSNIFRGLVLI